MFLIKLSIAFIIFGDILLILGIVVKRMRREYSYRQYLNKVAKYKKMLKDTLNSKGKGILLLNKTEVIADRGPIKKALLECIEETSSERREKRILWLFREIGLAEFYFAGALSSNHITRARAIDTLGDFKIEETVDVIVKALRERSDIVAASSARALGNIGGDVAIKVLVGLLNDPHLAKQSMIISLIENVGNDAVPYLNKILINGSNSIKVQVVKLLGDIGDERAIPLLLYLLDSDNIDLRSKATESLGKLKAMSCLAHIQNLASDDAWPVRAMAAKALGYFGHPSSIKFLKELIRDEEWGVRKNSGRSLSELGIEGEYALIEMLKSVDKFAREMSAAELESNGAITKFSLLAFSDDRKEAENAQTILFDFDNVISKTSMATRFDSIGQKDRNKEKETTGPLFQKVG